MKISKIETEWADGINWNDDLDSSVWDGFYVMVNIEDSNGNKFALQYVAAQSVKTERDYINQNDFEKLESLDNEIVSHADSLADEISKRTIQREIDEKRLEEIMDDFE